MFQAAYLPENYFHQHNVADIFGNGETCEVDLGCGDGGFLLQMARQHPGTKFLGIERLLGRVRSVCSNAETEQLENVRVLRLESRYFLEWFIRPGSISRLHYLCPDPWPKTRHHKNRLVQDHFLPVLHRALTPQGEFLFKTDHEEYYEWVLEHMDNSTLFRRLTWEENEFYYPKTDFQLHWESMGKHIHRARFAKTEPTAQA